jgi:energy-converting hydrogenase Eha subunit B
VPRARWGLRGAATIGSRVGIRSGDVPGAQYVSAILTSGGHGRDAFGARRGAGG